ncbi:MAG TPA: zinc ribbon domain-containing protein [Roseovarius sp.]|nr:zinc ribbon domain-containing protein [Roseovarius sp.]
MPKPVRFRCNNCGHRFETHVLDEDEQRETRRKDHPITTVHCPECHRTDIRHGWE